MTVWGDDEERSKKITEYYTDVLNKIGLNAKPKIIGAETYFQTIGDFEGVNPVTMFDDWFQDFPHPGDFSSCWRAGRSNRLTTKTTAWSGTRRWTSSRRRSRPRLPRMWWNRPRSWTGT